MSCARCLHRRLYGSAYPHSAYRCDSHPPPDRPHALARQGSRNEWPPEPIQVAVSYRWTRTAKPSLHRRLSNPKQISRSAQRDWHCSQQSQHPCSTSKRVSVLPTCLLPPRPLLHRCTAASALAPSTTARGDLSMFAPSAQPRVDHRASGHCE